MQRTLKRELKVPETGMGLIRAKASKMGGSSYVYYVSRKQVDNEVSSPSPESICGDNIRSFI